jgi:predicted nuclease of predicted toxin-antitoxin system
VKFLVDNQLPKALAHWLRQKGYYADHVLERGQGQTDDRLLWQEAIQENRIVVSKDEDFFILATRPNDPGSLLWLRIGNCRTQHLLTMLDQHWPAIESALQTGQRIVELR